MAGYSGTPLWKKLGYKNGMSAYVDGGPNNYLSLLALPADLHVTWLTQSEIGYRVRAIFSRLRASNLKRKLESYRKKIVPDGDDLGFLAEEDFRSQDRYYRGHDSRCGATDGTCRCQSLCSG